jgi:hypothetical protein
VREFIKMLIQQELEACANFKGKTHLDTNFPYKSFVIHLCLLWTILQAALFKISQTWGLWNSPLIPLSWSRVSCFKTFKFSAKRANQLQNFGEEFELLH